MAVKHKALYILLCTFSIILASCGDDTESTLRVDAAGYFPLEDSVMRVYDVTEVTISPLEGRDTLRYELMEGIMDTFVNSSGDINYVMYRYTRADENSEWTFLNTAPLRIQDRNYVLTENNIPYIKLASPLYNGKEWDGNAYNGLSSDTYQCLLPGEGLFTEGAPPLSITIIQEDVRDTIVSQDIRKEVYVLGSGLTYKESTLLNYCTRPDCLGQGIIEDGRVYTQTIKDIW